MTWRLLLFGSDTPGRARVATSITAYIVLALAIDGWFAPVVPAPWLSAHSAWLLLWALLVALAMGVALRMGRGKPESETGQHVLAAFGLSALATPSLWLALAKGVPDLALRFGGMPF
jgi:hypothetical protein